MHAPALDPVRANHDLVGVDDRLGPEIVAYVEEGDEGAAVIRKRCQAFQDEPLDPFVELAPL
ncbi:MAG: hypothetical protein H0W90_00840 [Actinobacteria bacterium]|nr:hypothetical protein [Actinomycetota bacterium]